MQSCPEPGNSGGMSATVGEMFATVEEMSATVGKLNMLSETQD